MILFLELDPSWRTYDLCLHIVVIDYLTVCFVFFQIGKVLKKVSSFLIIIDLRWVEYVPLEVRYIYITLGYLIHATLD